MPRVHRKYIESHWLVFVIQGVIASLCGWFVMFSSSQDEVFLITTMGVMLLLLGGVEFFNLLHRERAQVTWGFTLVAAATEIVVGLTLLFLSQQDMGWSLGLLAIYTLVRGVCEICIGFKSVDDRTDKFIWVLCGVCGVVIGFVVLNSGHFAPGTFVKFFASYLVILGLANLIYGFHNCDQKLLAIEERRAQRAARAKTKAKAQPKSKPKRKSKATNLKHKSTTKKRRSKKA